MKLSDEELSRWIAEKLEPSESLPEGEHLDAEYSQCDTSPNNSWIVSMLLSKATGFHVLGWEHRDMVNDPAMTVMLLGKMTEPQLWDERTSEERKRGDPIYWGCTANMADEFGSVFSENLGRAVAEAFALANGWTE